VRFIAKILNQNINKKAAQSRDRLLVAAIRRRKAESQALAGYFERDISPCHLAAARTLGGQGSKSQPLVMAKALAAPR
jgi:hypothetical protein